MISFLEFSAFVITLIYQFLFFWMLHTFIPLRKSLILRILAFFASLPITDVLVYTNDLANILLSLCGLILYLFVFHQGKIMEKITAVFTFYSIMISTNFLMMDVSSKIFFAVTNASNEQEK